VVTLQRSRCLGQGLYANIKSSLVTFLSMPFESPGGPSQEEMQGPKLAKKVEVPKAFELFSELEELTALVDRSQIAKDISKTAEFASKYSRFVETLKKAVEGGQVREEFVKGVADNLKKRFAEYASALTEYPAETQASWRNEDVPFVLERIQAELNTYIDQTAFQLRDYPAFKDQSAKETSPNS